LARKPIGRNDYDNKSHFKKFLSCPNEYWLDHHFPADPVPMSVNGQFRREIGYEVEHHARTLPQFAGANVSFGTEFQSADLYAKADIVITDEATGGIDIYEVKSGASAKEDYQIDLAFQCHVAAEAGFVVRQANLITVNTAYLFDGTFDAVQMLRITDETETVKCDKGDARRSDNRRTQLPRPPGTGGDAQRLLQSEQARLPVYRAQVSRYTGVQRLAHLQCWNGKAKKTFGSWDPECL
jgi:hypothetical protein